MALHPISASEPASKLTADHKESARPITAGTGMVRFVCVGSRTVLARAFATSPLKILNPYAGDQAAWVYTSTYGGGLVGGDALRLTIDVEPRARAVVTTQSSTKVYRSAIPATQQVTGHIGEQALLVVAPDPTVCFAGSSFLQEQRYHLNRDASLVVVDWLTCGRRAMGERWAFDRYAGRLELLRDGRRLLYDSVQLSPDDGPIAERMGRVNVWGTVVLIGPLVSEAAGAAVALIASLPAERRADLIVSAAPLGKDGALVRMAGESVEQVGAVVRQHLSVLGSQLGDGLWSRKW